jgi:hypothetical protein
MVYACNNLSIGKDWSQQYGFLKNLLKSGDHLIIIGDLFAQKSPDLKCLLAFQAWLTDLDIKLYHLWRKEYVIFNNITAGDVLAQTNKNVIVVKEDLKFEVGNKNYVLSPEECKHEYVDLKPDYYLCTHDPLLYGGTVAEILNLPDILPINDANKCGITLLTENGPNFLTNEYSPKNMEVDIRKVEDLTTIEENIKRDLPNAITVNVDSELMKDQKFRVQLQEHMKNGGIKNLKIISEEVEQISETINPIETDDMFDLEKLKEKVKQKIHISNNPEKVAAEKIFDKVFSTYVRTQKMN